MMVQDTDKMLYKIEHEFKSITIKKISSYSIHLVKWKFSHI